MKKLLLLCSLLLATNAWGEYIGLECKGLHLEDMGWYRVDLEKKEVLVSWDSHGKVLGHSTKITDVDDKTIKFGSGWDHPRWSLNRTSLFLSRKQSGSILFYNCEKYTDETLLKRRDRYFEDIILNRKL